jgi:hypothetical protein
MRNLLLSLILIGTCVPAQAQIFGRKIIRATEAEIDGKRIRDIATTADELADGRTDQLITAAALKAALDALPARDTANYRVRVVEDSILVYYVEDEEVGRDTVRPRGVGSAAEIEVGDGLRGGRGEPVEVDLDEIASRIYARNVADAAEQRAIQYADMVAVTGSAGQTLLSLPSTSVDHRRKIQDAGMTLKPWTRYRFTVDVRIDRDTFFHAQPYAATMVIEEIERDRQKGRERVEGTFYVQQVEGLSALYQSVDWHNTKVLRAKLTVAPVGAVDSLTARTDYYHDQPPAYPLIITPVASAMNPANWDQGTDHPDGVKVTVKYTFPEPIPEKWANVPSLATDGYRYLKVSLVKGSEVDGDMSRLSLAISDQEDLAGTLAKHRMYRISETAQGSYYVRIPKTMDQIRSLGFYFDGPPVLDAASNPRTSLVITEVSLVNRLPWFNEGLPNASVLNTMVHAADPGETVDMAFLPIEFGGGRVSAANTQHLTLRNTIAVDSTWRGANDGNSAHFYSLSDASNFVGENLSVIYSSRDDREALTGLGRTDIDNPYWVSRVYDSERGLRERVDVWPLSAGDTVEIYVQGTDRLIHRHIATKDTAHIWLSLPRMDDMTTTRILPDSSSTYTGEYTVAWWNVVEHDYEDEFSSAFLIGGQETDSIYLEYIHAEGLLGDGLQVGRTPREVHVNYLTSLGASRQLASVNDGRTVRLKHLWLDRSGRSGLDVEPYDDHWLVDSLYLEDIFVKNVKGSGFITNHWNRIYRMELRGYRDGGGGAKWLGGGVRARLDDIQAGGVNLTGHHMLVTNVVARNITLEGGRRKATPFKDTLRAGSGILRDFRLEKSTFGGGLFIVEDSLWRWTGGEVDITELDPSLDLVGEFGLSRFASGTPRGGLLRNDLEAYFPMMLPENEGLPLVSEIETRLDIEQEDEAFDTDLDGTYYYRLGVILPGREKREVLVDEEVAQYTNTTSAELFIRGRVDFENGFVAEEFNLYRGSSPGQYDAVYRFRKNEPDMGGALGIKAIDRGDSITVYAGNTTGNRFYGYPLDNDDDSRAEFFLEPWDGPAGEYLPEEIGVPNLQLQDNFLLGGKDPVDLTPLIQQNNAEPVKGSGLITVALDGSGDFTSLNEAVDSARQVPAGQSVQIAVKPGVYTITNENIDRERTAIVGLGNTPSETVIQDFGGSQMFRIQASRVALKNLTLRAVGDDNSFNLIRLSNDSVVLDQLILDGGQRLEFHVETDPFPFTSVTLNDVSLRGSGKGIQVRNGISINGLLSPDVGMFEMLGGKVLNSVFGGRVRIFGGQFIGNTVGSTSDASSRVEVIGDATILNTTILNRSETHPALTVIGGNPILQNVSICNYSGNGNVHGVDIHSGATLTMVNGAITRPNGGAAIGNSVGTLSTLVAIGTLITGGYDDNQLDVEGSPIWVAPPALTQSGLLAVPTGIVQLPLIRRDNIVVPPEGTQSVITVSFPSQPDYVVTYNLNLVTGTWADTETVFLRNQGSTGMEFVVRGKDPTNTYSISYTINLQ